MEPTSCEIMIRIRLPIALVTEIDKVATSRNQAIDDMLAGMLIQAWKDREDWERELAAMNGMDAHPLTGGNPFTDDARPDGGIDIIKTDGSHLTA